MAARAAAVLLIAAIPAADTGAGKPASGFDLQVEMRGPGRIVDGDTIAIGRVRFRLYGIDAPEPRDPGGAYAEGALKIMLTLHRRAACRIVAPGGRSPRPVVICSTAGSKDVGVDMVRGGYARVDRRFTDRKQYLDAEADAKANRAGLWKCKLKAPPAWQRLKRAWCP